ncbi:MAG: PEP-CTERM system TPR-repeat protein PrsT [Dechloromonas sp.]|jgi:putative PEP-CTERM system TPR-repeat lipoprotein|nr:PEP-CTERM system TPR-repeat protein PrsT [Dechloromonas sp.]
MRTPLVALLFAALTATAQAADPKASKYYEDALKRYEAEDLAGAIIQLKNVLQIDRQMLAAHVLMGRAMLANGDLPGAEAAFEEALRLGVSRGEVALPLGQVYMLQGKHETLLERITPGGLPPALQAEVLILRANAQSERRMVSAATRSLEEARAADPSSINARLSQAALAIRTGDLARATELSDEALKLAPQDAGAWNVRASILHLKGDIPGALAAYGKAVAANSKYIDPRLARAGLFLDLGRLGEAEQEVADLDRITQREPRTYYLRALIASQRGDVEAARKALAELTRVLDSLPPNILTANRQLLFLAGLAHHGLGNREKAMDNLTVYLRQYPGDPGATKLLASLHLDRGEATRVMTLIEPLLRGNPNDPRALALLASAYMQEGNHRRAAELLDRAVQLSGGDAGIRTDFAFSLLGSGRAEKGLEQLQLTLAKDPKQARAGLALATHHLRSGQAKKAIEIAEKLVKNDPGNLTAANLLGVARLAAGDTAGGRKAYEQVIAKDSNYQPALINLARLDLAEGKVDAARQRLVRMIGSEQKNVEAMIELAALEEKQRRLPEAIRWLEKARAEPPGQIPAGLRLADLHLRSGNPAEAVTVARELVSKNPENLRLLDALARAQLAAGEPRAARQTLAEMTRYANYDAEAQLQVARLQAAAGNPSGAVYSLEKALGSQPDMLAAQILLAEVSIDQKDYPKAEQLLRQIGERQGGSAAATRLQGDIQLRRGQHAAAIASYQAALRKSNTPDIALRIFHAHLAAGDLAKGTTFLQQWHKDNPGHYGVLRTIADAQLQAGNLAAARSSYEQLLKMQPDDADVLNNLAQTAFKQNDKAAASHAEKALALRPQDANILDTLGWILVRQGQLDRGLALLRDARLRAPDSLEIRYHLAYALHQSGRNTEARDEIAYALKGGSNFEGVDDARRLQKEIGK